MRNTRVIIRGLSALTGVAIGLIITAGAAFADPGDSSESPAGGSGDSADIVVDFDCMTADVSSTKDISNVRLLFVDGSEETIEGLTGGTGSFSGTGDNSGKTIATIWVKSGSNHSGDGSGFGQRFDSDAACSAQSPTTTSEEEVEESENTEPSGGPDDEVGPPEHSGPSHRPTDIGTAVVIERPSRFVAAKPATPSAAPGEPAVPATPAAPALVAAASASAPAVESAPAPARKPEVLGVQLSRAVGVSGGVELARTGPTSLVLAGLGSSLTAFGVAMVGASRRLRRR